ncbi:PIN domain-containing protein [Arsenicicoccus sp. oral taxon 190]|uniref:PIN domain-containing protein n=1 Tax=Arsenicicoccus sp. oral taxon 190 TaxID=1658671 RepID=UPI00067A34EE|nr:PIN domain-containing protein [Arsenicicoccus sp. oral taxon 190]AKT50170.1 ribonuclease [Arsenicicoccus sp. oral taxon 190]
MTAGRLDTSVWIAGEIGRPISVEALPERSYVSVITVAEIEAGVLAAGDVATRAARMATATALAMVESLPVDGPVAREWATMRVLLRDAGRRVNVNDLWIAATARAHDLTVYTQDGDFDVLAEIGGIRVVHV